MEIANSTEYEIVAKIWSDYLDRTERLAKRISPGRDSINRMIKSDPGFSFWQDQEIRSGARTFPLWAQGTCEYKKYCC